jgi:hypothetical protein
MTLLDGSVRAGELIGGQLDLAREGARSILGLAVGQDDHNGHVQPDLIGNG